jgi:hypothetical protein
MVITPTLMAALLVLVTGAIGARRGWGRELLTCAIVLGTLLFLQLGGLAAVGNLFSSAAGSVTGGAGAACGGSPSTTEAAVSTGPSTFSDLVFGGMVGLGYYAGNKHGPPGQTLNHRLMGIVPGVITGGSIVYYLNNSVLYPGARTFLGWVAAESFLASLPVLLGIGLISALAILFVTWRSGSAGKGH